MIQSGKIVRLCLVATIAMLAVFAAPGAGAARRVALVIGNDKYDTLPGLNNAATDARGVAAKLGQLGFEVVVRLNAGRRAMGRALAEFEGKAAQADVALVFYAGHGVQADGKNYLIPSNAQIEVEADLRFEGIAADDFLLAMKTAGAKLNIVIIDACRDNPLPRRTRSAARGLTVTQVPTGTRGTAIIYSAAPGQTAQDGPKGGHGVFTGALLRVLDMPGLNLEQVFKETAKRVARATQGRQDPWINSSVKGEFHFNATIPTASPTRPTPDGGAAELLFWKSIKDSRDAEFYQAYIDQYPNGTFVGLARVWLQRERQARRDKAMQPQASLSPRAGIQKPARSEPTAEAGSANRFDGYWMGQGKLLGGKFNSGFSSDAWAEYCGDFSASFEVRNQVLWGELKMEGDAVSKYSVRGRVHADGVLEDARGEGPFEIELSGTLAKGCWELETCRGLYVARRDQSKILDAPSTRTEATKAASLDPRTASGTGNRRRFDGNWSAEFYRCGAPVSGAPVDYDIELKVTKGRYDLAISTRTQTEDFNFELSGSVDTKGRMKSSFFHPHIFKNVAVAAALGPDDGRAWFSVDNCRTALKIER